MVVEQNDSNLLLRYDGPYPLLSLAHSLAWIGYMSDEGISGLYIRQVVVNTRGQHLNNWVTQKFRVQDLMDESSLQCNETCSG